MSLRPIGISVYAPVANASVELQGVGKKTLNENSYALFNIDSSWTDTHLFINADGYEFYSQHISLTPGTHGIDVICFDNGPQGPFIINLPSIKKKITVLSPITVSGKDFQVNGMRYKPKACSDFLLVYKKSQGIDITPILKQRKEAGADMLRIFTMAFNIANFNPRTYNVMQTLSSTLDDIHSFGMRAEVEGFADVQLIGLNPAEQQMHHDTVCAVIRDKNSVDLYDLVNEMEKNGIDSSQFIQPAGIISSSGSRQNNKPPKPPYWSFGTFHPRRDGEDYYFSKWRADMTPQSEVYYGVEGEPAPNMPIFPDEPRGFAAINENGKRSNYPPYAYQLGVTYGMFLNGSCFHSTNGIFSDLFDDVTLQCAKLYFQGCSDAEKGW